MSRATRLRSLHYLERRRETAEGILENLPAGDPAAEDLVVELSEIQARQVRELVRLALAGWRP